MMRGDTMLTVTDCLLVLRRRIGDTDLPYTYDDTLLTGYINDSVQAVELDWTRGFDIDSNGNFTSTESYVVSKKDLNLFSVKAHYLITLRTKDKADRDNFRMVKGRLTLDNTGQSKDHMDTLNMLDKEYKRTLHQTKNGTTIKGVRME